MTDQPGHEKPDLMEDPILGNEKQYQSLFENTHTVMLLIEPTDASIVDANPAAVAFYGYSREDIKRLKITDINILPHDEAMKVFEKIRTGKEFQFLFQHKLASGEIRDVEAYVGPIRIGSKSINYAIVYDVTEKRRAQEALQKAHDELEQRVLERTAELKETNELLKEEIEKRIKIDEALQKNRDLLETIFDGITDPLIMLDADMSIKILNGAALKYYGVSEPDDLVGECCFKALRGEAQPCNGCQIPSAILSGEAKTFERKGFIDSDRSEKIFIYTAKIAGSERTNAIIRISDVTEQKLMQRQLIQSEKLASLGLLMSGIAHEINNPSNFITLNIPVMRDYMDKVMPIIDDYAKNHEDFEFFSMSYPEFREDVYKLLDNIEYGASRITSIVSDLGEFARMEDTKKQARVDLKSVIKRAIGICKGQIKKRIKYLDVNIAKDLPKILTNPKAVEQVLINLLVNAAQSADKEGSRVKLDVSLDKTSQKNMVIEVEDNGRGMDEKTKSRLFTPFFTTKSTGEGTGLGLYVSNNLVEGLGGRIEVESEPEKGSTFRIILPNVQ
ncbi:MAG: PAS domain S-box protein [Desulfobacteraceae bacterium]|nr:MAG: PAS domain S-box protein [Desulfobacteraceae bacterium]